MGEHLQDHLEVTSSTGSKQPVSVAPALKWYRTARGSASSGCSSVPGPGATNHFEAGGFIRGDDEVAYPNLMFHFLPVAIRYDGSSPAGGHGYQVHVGPMYSDARGSVKITSLMDPRAHPALRFNYLSTEQDRREWLEAVRGARHDPEPARVRAVQRGRALAGPRSRPTRRSSWVAARRRAALHPSCTCRMGVDEPSVVDPLTMRVRGSRACGWWTPR